MTLLINYGERPDEPAPAGLLELDFDPAAERYVVQHRQTMETLWNGPVPVTNPAKLRVPLLYTTDYNLMALIIDDTGTPMHYVTGNDKIQAQLVDARMVTFNP